MANANSTASVKKPSDLHEAEYSWGNIYKGTEADLVAAGLLKTEWFPGKPGRAKTSSRIALKDGAMQPIPIGILADKEAGLISIRKYGKYKFEVWVHFTKDEREKRSQMEEIKKLHAEKQKELDSAPKNIEEFRVSKSESIEWFLRGMFDMFRRASNGYHYSRKVVEEASDLISDLMELAEEGQVYFDQQRQDYFLDDVEKKAQKAHPEFSAFMATTLAIGKAALND